MTTTSLPAVLQRFLTDRLQSQLGASPHTIASYPPTATPFASCSSSRPSV